MVLGTLGYMSPEQVRGLPADYRCDIFSFGAILYEMLSGQPPFRRETTADTMAAILHEQPPELSSRGQHIPTPIVRIVERCLEKTPSMRFHSTEDLAFALAGGLAPDPEIHAPDSVSPDGKTRKRGAARWAAVAALVGLTAAIALAAIAFLRRPADDGMPVKLDVAAPQGVVQMDPTIRISPDGTRLVFVGTTSDGVRRLWLRPLGSLEAAPLNETEGATNPFWSPAVRPSKRPTLARGSCRGTCGPAH